MHSPVSTLTSPPAAVDPAPLTLRSLLLLPVLALALLLVTGCGKDRPAFVVDHQGELRRQTPETMRSYDENKLAHELSEMHRDNPQVTVAIGENPQRLQDDDDFTVWHYANIHAQITIAGGRQQEEALQELATKYLRDRRLSPGTPVQVDIQFVAPVAEAAVPVATPTRGEPTPQTAQPKPAQVSTAPTGAATRTYVLQSGDTLADLAAAFYGDTKHWRLIRDANPGLDPAALPIGSSINIPAQPPSGE